jgi:hypothetical protein
VGSKNILAWCRDVNNDWKSEFKEGKKPLEITNAKTDFTSLVSPKQIKIVSSYDPWKDEWAAMGKDSVVSLSRFKRSLVIKIEKR